MHLPSMDQGLLRLWNFRLTRILPAFAQLTSETVYWRISISISLCHFALTEDVTCTIPFCKATSRSCHFIEAIKVNVWWSGELTLARGSLQEQWAVPNSALTAAALLLTAEESKPSALMNFISWHPLSSSWIFLPDLGVKSSAAENPNVQNSQEEIHILPKARAKWDHSSCSGCSVGAAGLCEANLGSNSDRLQGLRLRSWSGTNSDQKKSSPWSKRGRPWNSVFKCIYFLSVSKRSVRAVTLENDSLQFCSGPGALRSTYRTYLLAAVLYPQLSLTKCIHSSLSW